jgi:hypothetical protein
MAGTIKLSSGYNMPLLGLGVWRMDPKAIRDLPYPPLKSDIAISIALVLVPLFIQEPKISNPRLILTLTVL